MYRECGESETGAFAYVSDHFCLTINKMSRVYMDISIGGIAKGRLEFELYNGVVPKTANNFRALCTGENGYGYKGTKFHRVVPGFVAQGGDFTRGNGTGGYSIYGEKFDDESFAGKAGTHTGLGCLSMANKGPNTNGSQFFICLGPTDWLDGKHVVFGNLVEGHGLLKTIESVGSSSGRPKYDVVITDCGQL